MWLVVAFSAFKPRSVLDIDPSQPLPCCLQLFFNPQKNDGLAALSRSNPTLFGLIVNGAVFLFADGIHRHNGSLINDLVHQPTARSLQLHFAEYIPLFRSHKKTPQTLVCGAFEGGGRSRNRTGVGGFAIHYFLDINQQLTVITIPQMLQFYAPERQAYKGFDFEMRNRFNPQSLLPIDNATLIH